MIPEALRTSPTTALVLVSIAIFIDMLVYGMIVPILPTYATDLGASQTAIGILFACYAIGLLVATPFFGALSDRVGRRGPLLAGLGGLGLATLLFAFASSLSGLIAARLLQGLAAAATWTAGLALLADLFPPEKRGAAMGTAMGGMVAGTLVGPPFGGLLFEWGGYGIPFLTAALGALLIAFLVALCLNDPRLHAAAGPSLVDLAKDRPVLTVSGAIILQAAALTLLEPTLPLYLEHRFDASAAVIGLLFGASTLAYGVSAPLSGVLADRGCYGPMMAVGLVALALTLPLLAWSGSLAWAAWVLVLIGLVSAPVLVPALPALADRVDRLGGGAYASVYAVLNVAYALGMVVGPLLGGILAEYLGFGAALGVVALLLLAYAPVLWVETRQ
jgi:multidrug resistance protein